VIVDFKKGWSSRCSFAITVVSSEEKRSRERSVLWWVVGCVSMIDTLQEYGTTLFLYKSVWHGTYGHTYDQILQATATKKMINIIAGQGYTKSTSQDHKR